MSKAKLEWMKPPNTKGKTYGKYVPYTKNKEEGNRNPSLFVVHHSHCKPRCWTIPTSKGPRNIVFKNHNWYILQLNPGLAFAKNITEKPLITSANKKYKIIEEVVYEAKNLNSRTRRNRELSQRKTQYEKALSEIYSVVQELNKRGHTVLIPDWLLFREDTDERRTRKESIHKVSSTI